MENTSRAEQGVLSVQETVDKTVGETPGKGVVVMVAEGTFQ